MSHYKKLKDTWCTREEYIFTSSKINDIHKKLKLKHGSFKNELPEQKTGRSSPNKTL